jgi:hypothetical protein
MTRSHVRRVRASVRPARWRAPPRLPPFGRFLRSGERAGWASGQLESEILANGWLTCPADAGLIFDPDFERKYDRALPILGVDEGMLSSDAGHA